MAEMWSGIDEPNRHCFAVYGRSFEGGKQVLHRPHRQVEAASTIKLLILVCLLKQAQEGEIPLDGKLEVRLEDLKAGGSGMLQSWMPRWPVEVSQLCLAMMGTSDNVATNALLRSLGVRRVNAFAQQIGLKNTQLLMAPINTTLKQKGKFRIGITTAADMGTLLARLLLGELLDSTHTEYALGALEAVQQSYITRGIDTRRLQRWGSKTGTLYQALNMVVLNECGFVIGAQGNKAVLCVFSQQPNVGPLPYSQDSPARREVVRVMTRLYAELA